MRKGGKENSRRVCLYIYIYMGYEERKRVRVYTRSCANGWIFLTVLRMARSHDSSGVCRQTIISYHVTQCLNMLRAPCRSPSVHRSLYHTQPKKKLVYTRTTHWLSLAVLYAKIENGCTRYSIPTSTATAAVSLLPLRNFSIAAEGDC